MGFWGPVQTYNARFLVQNYLGFRNGRKGALIPPTISTSEPLVPVHGERHVAEPTDRTETTSQAGAWDSESKVACGGGRRRQAPSSGPASPLNGGT